MKFYPKVFKIFSISLLTVGALGGYCLQKNLHTVNASNILYVSPKIKRAFSLKRALTNTRRRNDKMRARSLFRELCHVNHLSHNHADVMLAIIKARTTNLKNTKHGFFNKQKSKAFNRFAVEHHLDKSKVSSQYSYLNWRYHINSIFHKHTSKKELVKIVYAKIFNNKTLPSKNISNYLKNTNIK